MSRRKAPITNTDDIFAAAAINPRSASDTRVTEVRNQVEEEEDVEDEPVSQTMKHPIPKKIGPYEIRGTVGEGAFSVVKLAYSPEMKQYFACKVIERIRLKHNDLEHRFECEIRVHQQMHHPGIVNLIDILEDEHFYYVFLEFCPGGELFQHIVDSGRLQEDQAKPIMKQILESVHYIHQMGVSHRDMKPENLLLDQVGHTKISDFGLSRFLDKNGLASTPCGSPCYASPECISGAPYNGRTSDCWSCGVILYAMVTGQLPWTKRNQAQLFEQIKRGEYTIPNYLSHTCRDFISSLMCVDYKKRLTTTQALNHPFLAGVTVPLFNMLNTSNAIVSLKKVDAFFGVKDEEIEYNLVERNKTSALIDFEKVVREIRGPKVRQAISPPSKKRVGGKSGRSILSKGSSATEKTESSHETSKTSLTSTLTLKSARRIPPGNPESSRTPIRSRPTRSSAATKSSKATAQPVAPSPASKARTLKTRTTKPSPKH
ncbi:CAMK family protein kinase [Tritrichomonas foetus]|uniref:CAMK family protein kinase n=1 Tax=Tritrichomonas foetus TaxID=1144522 RepID=A0A1J4JIK8_9EUKA|nr:CAMK family protein kinase [Tritrichomonas foetus]|eukprot:OHS98978.1 CAMK family protein kinase [Tritrichomonas foetus]